MNCRSFKILLPLCFLLPWQAYAQQLPLRVYTSADGLIRNDVLAMCQDSSGFLWFGTSDGLCRYDGTSFVPFPLSGLPGSNFINALLPSGNDLWAATNGGGLIRPEEDGAKSFLVSPHTLDAPWNRINNLCRVGNGLFLLGTDRGTIMFDGRQFFDPHDIGPVECLLADAQGGAWIGSNSGLWRWQRDAGVKRVALSGLDIRALASDTGEALWVGTSQGIRRLEPGRPGWQSARLAPPLHVLASLYTRSLLRDTGGSLWIGTDQNGVFQYKDGKLLRSGSANGLPADRVLSLLEDREHDIWIATDAGLCKLANRRILNHMLPGNAARAYVSTISREPSGALWFGTPYGASRLSGETFNHFAAPEGLRSTYVLSSLVDSAGTLWVGCSSGLYRLVRGEAKTRFVRVEESTLGHRVIRSLFAGAGGALWVGRERGFTVLRNGRETSFSFPDSFSSPLVIAFARLQAGSLWVGTEGNGLHRFAVKELPDGRMDIRPAGVFTVDNGIHSNSIRSLLADREGRLWVGLRFGGADILHFRGDSVEHIEHLTTADGLSGEWVRALLQDRKGRIWVATNRGLDCRYPDGTNESILLAGRRGPAGEDAFALFEDGSGTIWAGTSAGAVSCATDDRRDTLWSPPIRLVRFQVFGRDDTAALRVGHADLAFTQHTVAFEFRGLSFSEESAVRYRWMLAGLDSGWSNTTDRRYASYTHLPSGDYKFQVQARAGAGGWSTIPATFSFTIATPLWARWWFIGAVALVVMAFAYALHRFRMRQLMEVINVRNRIAADLHDDLGSTLSSIAIFSRLAEQEVASTVPSAAGMLRRIGASAQSMLESLDDIVWSIKPGHDTLETVMIRTREFAAELCTAAGISFSAEVPAGIGQAHLSLEARRQIYLTAKEAFHNIVKHSCCKNAGLALSVRGRALTLAIWDNGRGFDPGMVRPGNGLDNMRRRIAAIGGHVSLQSAPGEGTRILLTFHVS